LPVEHGGWGLSLEPAFIAMVLAPSWAGFLLTLGALGVFLIHHPLKIFWRGPGPIDRAYGESVPGIQRRRAVFFAILYGIMALAAFMGALFLAPVPFWVPILLALPLALVQLVHTTPKESRNLIPELCGGVALGATAPCVLIAGGWRLGPALWIWAILAVRTVSAIIYIRNKLRAARNADFSKTQVLWVHLAGLAFLGFLAFYSIVPWLVFIGFSLMAFHAFRGILQKGPAAKPRDIGMKEIFWGILNGLFIVAGYGLHRGAV
jgi:hypothetical protein